VNLINYEELLLSYEVNNVHSVLICIQQTYKAEEQGGLLMVADGANPEVVCDFVTKSFSLKKFLMLAKLKYLI